MSGSQKFYLCEKCKNLVALLAEGGGTLVCCGQPMTLLKANTEDASQEKHVPDVKITGNEMTVQIGSVIHPMEEAHHIQFIYVETDKGGQLRQLAVGQEPVATFTFTDESPIAVYEYCNLHGLWKKEV